MTKEGVDYSFSRPGGAALKAAGKQFAVRYLYSTGKGLTSSELADLVAHGIEVAVVYESTAGRALEGYAAGAYDAGRARDFANSLNLGSIPIYFAVDFNASSAQMNAVISYFSGVSSILGEERVGVYGSYAVVNAVRAANVATFLWQTYAWSAGKIADGIHLYQYKNGQNINGSVDFDRAYQDNYGQLAVSVQVPPSAPPPPPAPTPTNLYHLAVDGNFGPATVRAIQTDLNRTGANPKLSVDGNFGPASKKALQGRLNYTNGPVAIDGNIGPQTVKALQRHVGSAADGNWGPDTTRHLQDALNKGRF